MGKKLIHFGRIPVGGRDSAIDRLRTGHVWPQPGRFGLSDSRFALFPEEGRRRLLEPQALRSGADPRPVPAGSAGNGLRRPVGRRSHAKIGEGPAGAGRNSFPVRNAAKQGPHRLRADPRQRRSAPRDAPGRTRAGPSRPLQVHRLLHRNHPRRLADPLHHGRRGLPGSDLHRPRPPAHGGQRESWPGNGLPESTAEATWTMDFRSRVRGRSPRCRDQHGSRHLGFARFSRLSFSLTAGRSAVRK